MLNANLYNSTLFNSTGGSSSTLYYDFDVAQGEIPEKLTGIADVAEEIQFINLKDEVREQNLKEEEVSQFIDEDQVEQI